MKYAKDQSPNVNLETEIKNVLLVIAGTKEKILNVRIISFKIYFSDMQRDTNSIMFS